MRYKKIMMLTIILTCLLAVSAVCAAENATNDVVSVDVNEDIVGVEETTDDAISVDEVDDVVNIENDNQVILEENGNNVDDSIGNFTELYNLIENTPASCTLELDKDYNNSDGFGYGYGVWISKQITIDGKGHYLDGIYSSGIMSVSSSNVILKNLRFINGNYFAGGAISWYGSNGKLINCTFENNVGIGEGATWGGAVYWCGDYGSIINCTFKNNSATCGGAITWYGDNGKVLNCNFSECFVFTISKSNTNWGGAIYWNKNNGMIDNCSFINNYALDTSYGGAIYIRESNHFSINNCEFVNNSASSSSGYGGAIHIGYSDYCSIVNNTFINSTAFLGNSIYCSISDYCTSINNYFIPNFNNIVGMDDSNIIRRNSSLKLNNTSFNYQNASIFNALLSFSDNESISNKTIIVDMVNENLIKRFYMYTDKNGVGILYDELNELNKGIWNVTATFEGDDNYAPCNASATIMVLSSSSSLTIDNVNATVGQEVTLVSNVNSTLTVNEGIVTFFDGETEIGSANVVAGVATLNYVPTTIGNHIITAVYYSDNYKSSNDTAYLSVAKANTNINIESIYSNYFSNPTTITVNINSNNNDVKEGEVKFYVNDVLVKIENVYNGKVSIDYVANAVGSLKLTVIYNGTENYFASNTTTHFYVNQMPTTLSAESMVFDEQSYKTFVAELKDVYSHGVSGQTVKIELIKYSGESATFTAISNDEGIVVFDIGALAGGMWYVTGIYNGNNNYIGSGFVDKFIVVKVDTTTSIDGINNPQINHAYKIKANIHDETGKLVKEGVVRFYLDGVDIGSIDLSENNGHQSVNKGLLGAINSILENKLEAAAISDSYVNYIPKKVGKHTLTAVYEGTSIYKSSKSTTTFVVKNSQTTLTLKKVTVKRSAKKLTIQATLKVNGKVVKGKIIKFKFNKKTYKAKTNAKGVAKITVKKSVLKKLKKGKKVTYTATYDKITKKVTVKVK